MVKAVALLSGGLDSILAARLILEQGIELEAVNFLTVFCGCTARGKGCSSGRSAADKLGIKLKAFEVSRECFEIVKNPRYGYGSNINPCLDCRIFMLKKAARYMEEIGASFLITGEVLGQRPMSQKRHAMKIAERDSELEGLILRPLSARLLEPTIPEKKGMVDREKLLAIKGRSRKPQIELARQLGIDDYPHPAGGCLLTDPGFTNRMRDLIEHKPDFTMSDILLLKVGRHFRVSPETKFVVGRNKEENEELTNLASEEDIRFRPAKAKGPVGIGIGSFNKKHFSIASSIIARYSDKDESREIEVLHDRIPGGEQDSSISLSITEETLEILRI